MTNFIKAFILFFLCFHAIRIVAQDPGLGYRSNLTIYQHNGEETRYKETTFFVVKPHQVIILADDYEDFVGLTSVKEEKEGLLQKKTYEFSPNKNDYDELIIYYQGETVVRLVITTLVGETITFISGLKTI